MSATHSAPASYQYAILAIFDMRFIVIALIGDKLLGKGVVDNWTFHENFRELNKISMLFIKTFLAILYI